MIQGKVLVTGATGDTGRATVDELLARGHRVRALAHGQDERSKRLQERGVEVVYGDLLDFGQVKAALTGVQRAYFVYPIRPGILQATAYFAQAAKEAAVDGIVNMSQISAREEAKSHAATDHWLAERVFDWSGVTVAHIRPTYFAEWLLYLAPMIKAGLLHVPFGTGKHAPIAAEDQARVIVGILKDPRRTTARSTRSSARSNARTRRPRRSSAGCWGSASSTSRSISRSSKRPCKPGGRPPPRDGTATTSCSSTCGRSRSTTRTGCSRARTTSSSSSAAGRR